MLIEVVDDLGEISRLKKTWQDLYSADPEAQIFLSFDWLHPWLRLVRNNWFVLLAWKDRDGGELAGLLPMRFSDGNGSDESRRIILPAGAPAADFTGLLCRPEAEDHVVRALAGALLQIGGRERIEFPNMHISRRRLAMFASSCSKLGARVSERRPAKDRNGVDNSIAPFTRLPESWEEYLATRMSANSRQRARRCLKLLDAGQELSVHHATSDTLERDISILIALWSATWDDRKRAELGRMQRLLKRSLTDYVHAGTTDLCSLWRGNEPLAVHALYVDRIKRSLSFSIGGRKEGVISPPPSFLLHCYNIRRAISEKYVLYDFLRGNERYKYSFCTEHRLLHHLVIQLPARGASTGDSTSSRRPSEIRQ